jgi:hypothetical protein
MGVGSMEFSPPPTGIWLFSGTDMMLVCYQLQVGKNWGRNSKSVGYLICTSQHTQAGRCCETINLCLFVCVFWRNLTIKCPGAPRFVSPHSTAVVLVEYKNVYKISLFLFTSIKSGEKRKGFIIEFPRDDSVMILLQGPYNTVKMLYVRYW